jgi:hypothetical protein
LGSALSMAVVGSTTFLLIFFLSWRLDRISFLYWLARTFVLGAYWTDFARRLCRFVFSFLGGLLDLIKRTCLFSSVMIIGNGY